MASNDYQNTSSTGTDNRVVVGLFRNPEDAESAISELKSEGFKSSQIGAAFVGNRTAQTAGTSNFPSTADFGKEKKTTAGTSATDNKQGEGWWDRVKDAFTDHDTNTDVRRTTTTGTESSESMNYGTGEGHLGAAPVGDDYGYDYAQSDFAGSLAGLGIAPETARRLTADLGSNGAIVTVHDSGRAAEAEEILTDNNARIKHEGDGANASYPAAAATTNQADVATTDNQRIQLFGEVLRVHKDRVSRGEVRIGKEVISEQQSVQVPVTREELVIERMAGSNQPVDTAHAFEGEREIRIPLSEEHARADKQTVVREEIGIGKRAVTTNEQVDGTVRHEELRVDDETTDTTTADRTTTRR